MLGQRHAGLNLLPSAERKNLFPPPETRKIQPAVFTAPTFRSKRNLQTHEKCWLIRFAGPSVQIHAMAPRAARPFQVARNKSLCDKPFLAILAPQRR
jgi:hypothetical protein